VRFAGRFGITSEAALVERRSAGLDLGPLGTLSLGNSGPPADDGLSLGRFHTYTTDSTNALDQWRYGEPRSWNGAVWHLSKGGPGAASVTAFGHDRPTERAAGLGSEFHPWHSVSVRVGGSYLATADSASDHRPFFAVHFGIGAALELWKINASTCLTVHDGIFSPVILSLEHRSHQTRIDAVVTWLPGGLAAPRSSVVGTLLNRIGLDADTTAVPASLACIDWSVDRRIGEMFRIHPFVSYLFLANGAGADCRAGATADIRGPLDATVSYRYRPGGLSIAVPSDRHETVLAIKHHFNSRFESSLTARYYARSDGYRRIRAEIAPGWLTGSALKISPDLSLYSGSHRSTDFRWGCRLDLGLFPKVACNVRFEAPFTTRDAGETILDVRSVFYF
jgi:hypothetical protein